jgi:hypothetical protein
MPRHPVITFGDSITEGYGASTAKIGQQAGLWTINNFGTVVPAN